MFDAESALSTSARPAPLQLFTAPLHEALRLSLEVLLLILHCTVQIECECNIVRVAPFQPPDISISPPTR
eukprot:7107919-Pyramimonas_sp.AAC.1